MLRRLLSDKNIGQCFYNIKHQKWEIYNRQMNKIYKTGHNYSGFCLTPVDNTLADSIVEHTKEIKNIKQDISHIFSILDKLTKDVKITVYNTEQLEKRFMGVSLEERNQLDKNKRGI
jgi:hypothetical protein